MAAVNPTGDPMPLHRTNPFCKGSWCDNARCVEVQQCLYKSSSEEAREVMRKAAQPLIPAIVPAKTVAVTQEVRTAKPCTMNTALPTDSDARKDIPLARGVLDYFPAALAAVAELSRVGNEKHNPGEDLHWARGKSMDHADCIMRHLVERGKLDTDGLSHSVKVAWRALALLQEELEAQGAPVPRGARL